MRRFFEHPKQMLKWMDKKIFTILLPKYIFIWTYDSDLFCVFIEIVAYLLSTYPFLDGKPAKWYIDKTYIRAPARR